MVFPLYQQGHSDSSALKVSIVSVHLYRHLCSASPPPPPTHSHTPLPWICGPATMGIQNHIIREHFSLFSVTEHSLHPSFLPTVIFLWVYCWGHRLEDLWARHSMKTGFLRVTKCWLILWLKIIMCSQSLKGRKFHNFTFLLEKNMDCGITRLGVLAVQPLTEAE